MPGKISITEEEFRGLCAKYTREEIAQMKGATVNWVWSKTKKYGIKPVVVCKRCQKRFTPKGGILPFLQNDSNKGKKQTCAQTGNEYKEIKRI